MGKLSGICVGVIKEPGQNIVVVTGYGRDRDSISGKDGLSVFSNGQLQHSLVVSGCHVCGGGDGGLKFEIFFP